VDRGVRLTTSFVKRPGGRHGGDWTGRVEAAGGPRGAEVSLLYYAALEEGADGVLEPELGPGGVLEGVRGQSQALADWRLWWRPGDGVTSRFHVATSTPGLQAVTDTVMRSFRLFDGRTVGLEAGLEGRGRPHNLVVLQVTATLPFAIDIVFESGSNSGRSESLVGRRYTEALQDWTDRFHLRFEQTFHLAGKGFNASAVQFAQAALSNMVGGIGYFHGSSVVKSRYNTLPVPYWEAPLYTAVPSRSSNPICDKSDFLRSFFPRGFLWDEGFHNLLISRWDPEISADILAHWMDLLNSEGWIPREQVGRWIFVIVQIRFVQI
jgi:mannosyl-oligosaccharide glucosidase